jgi:hypothetical protein
VLTAHHHCRNNAQGGRHSSARRLGGADSHPAAGASCHGHRCGALPDARQRQALDLERGAVCGGSRSAVCLCVACAPACTAGCCRRLCSDCCALVAAACVPRPPTTPTPHLSLAWVAASAPATTSAAAALLTSGCFPGWASVARTAGQLTHSNAAQRQQRTSNRTMMRHSRSWRQVRPATPACV